MSSSKKNRKKAKKAKEQALLATLLTPPPPPAPDPSLSTVSASTPHVMETTAEPATDESSIQSTGTHPSDGTYTPSQIDTSPSVANTGDTTSDQPDSPPFFQEDSTETSRGDEDPEHPHNFTPHSQEYETTHDPSKKGATRTATCSQIHQDDGHKPELPHDQKTMAIPMQLVAYPGQENEENPPPTLDTTNASEDVATNFDYEIEERPLTDGDTSMIVESDISAIRQKTSDESEVSDLQATTSSNSDDSAKHNEDMNEDSSPLFQDDGIIPSGEQTMLPFSQDDREDKSLVHRLMINRTYDDESFSFRSDQTLEYSDKTQNNSTNSWSPPESIERTRKAIENIDPKKMLSTVPKGPPDSHPDTLGGRLGSAKKSLMSNFLIVKDVATNAIEASGIKKRIEKTILDRVEIGTKNSDRIQGLVVRGTEQLRMAVAARPANDESRTTTTEKETSTRNTGTSLGTIMNVPPTSPPLPAPDEFIIGPEKSLTPVNETVLHGSTRLLEFVSQPKETMRPPGAHGNRPDRPRHDHEKQPIPIIRTNHLPNQGSGKSVRWGPHEDNDEKEERKRHVLKKLSHTALEVIDTITNIKNKTPRNALTGMVPPSEKKGKKSPRNTVTPETVNDGDYSDDEDPKNSPKEKDIPIQNEESTPPSEDSPRPPGTPVPNSSKKPNPPHDDPLKPPDDGDDSRRPPDDPNDDKDGNPPNEPDGDPPDPSPPPSVFDDLDNELRHILEVHLSQPRDSPLTMSLQANGILNLKSLMALEGENIRDLLYPTKLLAMKDGKMQYTGTPLDKLSKDMIRWIQIATLYFRKKYGPDVRWYDITTEEFRDFVRTLYENRNPGPTFHTGPQRPPVPPIPRTPQGFGNPNMSQMTHSSGFTSLSRAQQFQKSTKRNVSDYSEFLQDKQWGTWKRDLVTTATYHDTHEVLDPIFAPRTLEETDLFRVKLSFMFLVFQTKVKTQWGQHLLRIHHDTGDAQRLYLDMVDHYTKSNVAALTKSTLLSKITTTQLQPSTWKGGYKSFFVAFLKIIADYEELASTSERFPDKVKMTVLQNAVSGVPALHSIKTDNDKELAHGRPPLTWQKYQDLLSATCAALDHGETVMNRRSGRPHRVANTHDLTSFSDDGNEADEAGNVNYEVNASVRVMKGKWKELSHEDKKTFQKLSEDAKLKILGIKGFADTEETTTEANLTEIEKGEIGAPPKSKKLTFEDEESDTKSEDRLMAMVTQAKAKHPGDITRVLAKSKDKKGQEKGNSHGKVNVHESTPFTPIQIPTSNQESIVDRGANYGVVGQDARILTRFGRFVSIQGLDGHEVQDLEIVTAATIVMSTKGPIILFLNEYAYSPSSERTIHSSVQIEARGNKVDDRSTIVGGKQEIVLSSGIRIPLKILHGIPRLRMYPMSGYDLNTHPKYELTSNDVWDPRLLDFTHSTCPETDDDETSDDDTPPPLTTRAVVDSSDEEDDTPPPLLPRTIMSSSDEEDDSDDELEGLPPLLPRTEADSDTESETETSPDSGDEYTPSPSSHRHPVDAYVKLQCALISLGFVQSKQNKHIWIRILDDHYEFVTAYADDIAFSFYDRKAITKFFLQKHIPRICMLSEMGSEMQPDTPSADDGNFERRLSNYLTKVRKHYTRFMAMKRGYSSPPPGMNLLQHCTHSVVLNMGRVDISATEYNVFDGSRHDDDPLSIHETLFKMSFTPCFEFGYGGFRNHLLTPLYKGPDEISPQAVARENELRELANLERHLNDIQVQPIQQPKDPKISSYSATYLQPLEPEVLSKKDFRINVPEIPMTPHVHELMEIRWITLRDDQAAMPSELSSDGTIGEQSTLSMTAYMEPGPYDDMVAGLPIAGPLWIKTAPDDDPQGISTPLELEKIKLSEFGGRTLTFIHSVLGDDLYVHDDGKGSEKVSVFTDNKSEATLPVNGPNSGPTEEPGISVTPQSAECKEADQSTMTDNERTMSLVGTSEAETARTDVDDTDNGTATEMTSTRFPSERVD